MLVAFSTTLEQMVRIFLFLLIGFAFNRLHILPKGAGTGVSKLVTTLCLPALMIYTNMSEFNLANVVSYGQLVLAGAFFWILTAIPSFPIAKKMANGNFHERGVYLYGLCAPNTGAVGTPLVLALMGTSGLFKFNLFTLSYLIMTYAWGVGLFLQVERKNPVRRFLVNMFNPVFVSVVVGLLLGALGAKNWMPSLFVDILGDISACYVPLSLILTGYTIADYPLRQVFHLPKSYLFTALRLIVIPMTAIVIAWLMDMPKETAIMMLLTLAGPCGMNVVVFPAAYGQDCQTGASLVLLSSLGAIITVPVLYALLQLFFP